METTFAATRITGISKNEDDMEENGFEKEANMKFCDIVEIPKSEVPVACHFHLLCKLV